MITDLIVDGKALIKLEFLDLPSRNKNYGHYLKKAKWTASIREEAFVKAREAMQEFDWFDTESQFPLKRALVIVDVYTPFQNSMDVHNVDVKAVLDGLTDAGVWTDDEWAFIPIVIFRWAGSNPSRNRKAVIQIHALNSLTIDDEPQILPAGRTRKE